MTRMYRVAGVASTLACLLTVNAPRCIGAQQSTAQGAPLDLSSVRRGYYEMWLSSQLASGLVAGKGLDMSDPYWPKISPFVAFTAKPPVGGDAISQQNLDKQRISVQTSFQDNLTISEEAEVLSASFRVSYGLSSASAALSKVYTSRQSGKAVYFFYNLSGPSIQLANSDLVWPSSLLSPVESVSDRNLRMRTFIGKFGTHFVQSIQYGARLAIRASLNTTDVTRQSSLSAKVNASLGAFAANGSFSESEKKSFRDEGISITAELTAGGVTPGSQALVLSSLDEVAQFMASFRSGAITLIPGPIFARMNSYWATFDNSAVPKLFEDFADLVRAPTPAPFGVPAGTIIAWSPPAGNVVTTAQGKRVIPPDGWAICDGTNGTPDLRGSFLRGSTDPSTLLQSGGAESHTHKVNISTQNAHLKEFDGSDANGSMQKDGGQRINHNHVVDFTTAPVSNLPPFVTVQYIIKL